MLTEIKTADAVKELLGHISELKKKTIPGGDSLPELGAQKALDGHSQRSVRAADNSAQAHGESISGSRFVERKELDNLRREFEVLKISINQSQLKEREGYLMLSMEDPNASQPKGPIAESLSSEVRNLKLKLNTSQLAIEELTKTVKKLTDDRNSKFLNLERKMKDEVETLQLFKDRLLMEIEVIKEKMSDLRSSHTGNMNVLPTMQRTEDGLFIPQGEELQAILQNKQHLETLTKIQENFKRETILNFSQVQSFLTVIAKKVGLSGVMPSNLQMVGTMNEFPSNLQASALGDMQLGMAAHHLNIGMSRLDGIPVSPGLRNLSPHKQGGNFGNWTNSPGQPQLKSAASVILEDPSKMKVFEDRLVEQEIALKRLIFDHKKELGEKIENLLSVMKETGGTAPRAEQSMMLTKHSGRLPGDFSTQGLERKEQRHDPFEG